MNVILQTCKDTTRRNVFCFINLKIYDKIYMMYSIVDIVVKIKITIDFIEYYNQN